MDSLEKTLTLGKIEGRRRGRQRMRWLDGITDSKDMSPPGVADGQGSLACYSPWDCKEMQPVHLKGDQSWVFIGRTDVEAEALIFWPSDAKS